MRQDHGDLYPSDTNDAVPTDPTAGMVELEYDINKFRRYDIVKPKGVFDYTFPDNRRHKEQRPKDPLLGFIKPNASYTGETGYAYEGTYGGDGIVDIPVQLENGGVITAKVLGLHPWEYLEDLDPIVVFQGSSPDVYWGFVQKRLRAGVRHFKLQDDKPKGIGFVDAYHVVEELDPYHVFTLHDDLGKYFGWRYVAASTGDPGQTGSDGYAAYDYANKKWVIVAMDTEGPTWITGTVVDDFETTDTTFMGVNLALLSGGKVLEYIKDDDNQAEVVNIFSYYATSGARFVALYNENNVDLTVEGSPIPPLLLMQVECT